MPKEFSDLARLSLAGPADWVWGVGLGEGLWVRQVLPLPKQQPSHPAFLQALMNELMVRQARG